MKHTMKNRIVIRVEMGFIHHLGRVCQSLRLLEMIWYNTNEIYRYKCVGGIFFSM